MGKREVTTLHRGGEELVMMAVKLLVKIAVMMMATAAFRRHRKRRGEGSPLYGVAIRSWFAYGGVA